MDKQIKGNKYAKGTLEMACVDLVARAAGVPAYQLFGGQVRDRPVLWCSPPVTPSPTPPKPRPPPSYPARHHQSATVVTTPRRARRQAFIHAKHV